MIVICQLQSMHFIKEAKFNQKNSPECATLKKATVKRCEIEDNSQEMAMMVD